MDQTREAMAQHLTERLCWLVARRDDTRVARRLQRKQVVDGVSRLDEGALLDDFFHSCRRPKSWPCWSRFTAPPSNGQ